LGTKNIYLGLWWGNLLGSANLEILERGWEDNIRIYLREVVSIETGIGLCSVVGFGIGGIEPLVPLLES
jgi:hypothetical protein